MSETTATADATSVQTAAQSTQSPPISTLPPSDNRGDGAGPNAPTHASPDPDPDNASYDDGEFAPCVPPPAPLVHMCRVMSLPDLWWELFYEHPGFMCEFCECLENVEYTPDEEEIVSVFCESCRIKIARLPENRCPKLGPGCLSVRWVGPLGEISDFCRVCVRAASPKQQNCLKGKNPAIGPDADAPEHSDEKKPRRRGKRGGRKVRARKERQLGLSEPTFQENPTPHFDGRPGVNTEPSESIQGDSRIVGSRHASRPFGLEIQLGKTPGLRVVESAPNRKTKLLG